MNQLLKGGDEWKVVSRLRRRLVGRFKRAGQTAKVKRRIRRRARHQADQALREGRQ